MIKHVFAVVRAVLFVAILGLVVSSSAAASTTITIQNNDAAGVGFNDPTPVAPVGNNNGTTLGQQRMNAFQFAANIWAATLNSGPTITIRASWVALTCAQNSATLAQTGTTTIHTGFSNGIPGVWYGAALANALSGSDRNGNQAEISVSVNINYGITCFQDSPWYLGLDGGHGGSTELVTVLIHEFTHGLGMQTFDNLTTGSDNGTPGIYDRFLRDNSTGKLWSQMTAAERVASAINTGNLVWAGNQVTSDVPSVLGTPRLRINSPAPIAGNYTVGTASFGPSISSPGVTGNVVRSQPLDGCSAFSNAASVSGNIAFIDRGGTCFFIDKVKNAQDAGATGVIIGNVSGSTNPTVAPGMGAAGPPVLITIPAESLNFADAQALRGQLGGTVNASIFVDHNVLLGADSSNRALMYAPTPVLGGSSVSHFDTSAFPNLVMEPSYSGDLGHSVVAPQDLTFSLLNDLGWTSTPPPPPPANDNFSAAQLITGCSGTVNGSNVSATKETGEPNHSPDNNGGTKSVWYQWQAPSTGSATITTAGSGFDTVLGVYTGTSVGSLTAIGKNDDSPTDTTSIVPFSATAGTTYMIAVDGYNNGGSGGDVGPITLNWTLSNCSQAPLQLILEESGPAVNQAAALDSVLFLRDPFPVVNSKDLFNLAADPNTRVMIFVTNLQLAQGESPSAVVINLVDSANQTFNIGAQDVRLVPNQTFSQVTFRLPDTLAGGTCQVKVVAHGQTSNTATLRIGN